jgi:site-specific DNA-methyltransferase (adenine-specific)
MVQMIEWFHRGLKRHKLLQPTMPMLDEPAAAGFYQPQHFAGYQYPRMQILTIKELLDGKRVQYPALAPVATFKRAQRKGKTTAEQQTLAL